MQAESAQAAKRREEGRNLGGEPVDRCALQGGGLLLLMGVGEKLT